MRKIKSLMCLCIVFNIQLNAQYFLGPMVGVVATEFFKLAGPDHMRFENIIGISPGLAIEIKQKNNISIQSELHYLTSGSIGKSYAGSSGHESIFKLHMNYLSTNMLAKFNISRKTTQFYFLTGPSIRLGLGMINFEQYGWNSIIHYENAEIKKLDYGLIAGFGVSFQVKQAKIFADARYYFGIAKVSEQARYFSLLERSTVQNRSIGFNVGYLFPITFNN